MKLTRVCSLFAVLFCAGSHAESYVIGVEKMAFAPHYSVDQQGQYQGFARELFDLFARHSGVQLSYQPLPVHRLLAALLQGEVDFKYPDSDNWAQAQKLGKGVHYSQAVVGYVDGVLVAPKHQGQPLDQLKRLGMVSGWTPWEYRQAIEAGQIQPSYSDDLRKMIRQTLKQDTDGAYFNVVVATHYLDNIRARPGALVFDSKLPHTRGSFQLSTLRHPELIRRFDRFLLERQTEIAALKDKYRVETNLDSQYLGMEQWKLDFLQRQKARASADERL